MIDVKLFLRHNRRTIAVGTLHHGIKIGLAGLLEHLPATGANFEQQLIIKRLHKNNRRRMRRNLPTPRPRTNRLDRHRLVKPQVKSLGT